MTPTIVKEDNEQFKGLHTMLRSDVYEQLTELAKQHKTFSGSWDYSETIRELLWVYKIFYNVNTRLDDLEVEMNLLNEKIMDKSKIKKEIDDRDEGQNPDGLLGSRKTKLKDLVGKEEKEDGTHKG